MSETMSDDIDSTAGRDPMTGEAPAGEVAGRYAWVGHRVRDRRRRVVVHRRYQLRAAICAAGLALLLLVPLNLGLYGARVESGAVVRDVAPELSGMIAAQDNLQATLLALVSFTFIAGVFLVTLLETHRTAGAAFQIAARMESIADGHYDVVVVLRDGDNLRELEEAFNSMSDVLRDRTWREIETLEHVAELAEEARLPQDAVKLAELLRDLAGRHRHLVE